VFSFIVRRLGQAVAVVLLVTLIVFILLKVLPGGTARALLGPRASTSAIKTFNHANGFDRPVIIQYLNWIWKILHWNLGYSYKYNQPVSTLLGTVLPKSLLLVGMAMLLAIIIAVPVGMVQGARRNRVLDHVITGLELVFYSMPVFFLGILLILYLSVDHHVFPSEAPQGATVAQVIQDPRGLVMPILTLMLITVALFARYMRSSTLDVLVQDYVRTARAKGNGQTGVLRHHVFRNALLPVVTLIGLSFPTLVSGAIVTETIFNYPGMGLMFWTAAQNRDYAILLGFTLVTGIATVTGSLAADIAYAALDPRVRVH
jgi:peptide/nickel transport system permease protein